MQMASPAIRSWAAKLSLELHIHTTYHLYMPLNTGLPTRPYDITRMVLIIIKLPFYACTYAHTCICATPLPVPVCALVWMLYAPIAIAIYLYVIAGAKHLEFRDSLRFMRAYVLSRF